jgi:hypothetical protein
VKREKKSEKMARNPAISALRLFRRSVKGAILGTGASTRGGFL